MHACNGCDECVAELHAWIESMYESGELVWTAEPVEDEA